MSKADYYETLGVSRDADAKVLKSAFRKRAMQYHPDRNPGDATSEAKFKELNEAYEALKDPQKRAAYDRFGHEAFSQGGGGGGFGNAEFGSSMSDIFEEFFGDVMGGRRSGAHNAGRGADLRFNMEVMLEDAYHGKTAEISVPTSVTCSTCTGSGAKPGTSPVTCPGCGGAGRVRASQGFFSVERTCAGCQGRGEVIAEPCGSCGGGGRVSQERTLSVSIPAGIEDGTRIRLAGEGEAGTRGGVSGDLYIFISITPHEFFQREGADLFCRVPLSMTTAALGGQFEVASVTGAKTRVKIPEGTQAGKQFRLKNKGMPVLRSAQLGDMYIQVMIETPQNLSRRQRELLKEFETESSSKNSPESSGFFTRMKVLFAGSDSE